MAKSRTSGAGLKAGGSSQGSPKSYGAGGGANSASSFTGMLGNRVKLTQANGDSVIFTNLGQGRIMGEGGDEYNISEIPGGLKAVFKRAAKVEVMEPATYKQSAPETRIDKDARNRTRMYRASKAPGARHFSR